MANRNSTRSLNKLIDSQVKSAKPKDTIYRMVDGGGLNLTIKPIKNELGHIVGSRKYWQMRYRFAGKENTASLGVYPDVTLADAREARSEIKKLLDAKINPNKHKQQQEDQEQEALSNTFKSVAERWYKLKSGAWKSDKHRATVWTSLETYVFPYFKDTPIDQITPIDCELVIERLYDAGKYETGDRVLQRMVGIFGYALRKLRAIDFNPAIGTTEFMARPETNNHHHSLDEKDMPRFLSDYKVRNNRAQTRIAARLLMLTAVRTNELIKATWDEIDFENKRWDIPAHRMKKNRPHVVPLSRQAIAAFKEAKEHCRNSQLVFPGVGSSKKPISNDTILFSIHGTIDSSKPEVEKLVGIKREEAIAEIMEAQNINKAAATKIREDAENRTYKGSMTGHGFRSVFSTHLHALKTKPKDGSEGRQVFNELAIEFQLAHVQRNRVRGSYDKNTYIEERIRVMDYWGSVCDSWEGSTVTPIHKVAS